MAALSVESSRLGKNIGRPRASAWRSNVGAQFAVGGYPAGNQDGVRARLLRRVEGAADQFRDDCALEAGQKFEGLRAA